MQTLHGHTGQVAEFVSRFIPPYDRGFGDCSAIGVIDAKGRLIAGCVYHNWQEEAQVVEMSCAAITKRWLTRSILREIFDYPFSRLGCQLIVFRIAPADYQLRRIFKALGTTEYLIPRLRGRDEAELILTLTDDAWNNGKFARK